MGGGLNKCKRNFKWELGFGGGVQSVACLSDMHEALGSIGLSGVNL